MSAAGRGPSAADLPTCRPMDVAGRAERLRAGSTTPACDALLVTNLANIRYLTGFTGSAGAAAGAARRARCSSPTAATATRRPSSSPRPASRPRIEIDSQRRRTRSLGRGRRASPASGSRPTGDLGRAAPLRRRVVPGRRAGGHRGPGRGLRAVKDAGEVARLEAASAIADAALAAVRPRLGDGPTESGVRPRARHRDAPARRAGSVASRRSSPPGPNGAKPHAPPGDRPIVDGDLVVLDFGALVDGYHSDMTRTVAVGEPSTDPAADGRGRGRGPGRRGRRRAARGRRPSTSTRPAGT